MRPDLVQIADAAFTSAKHRAGKWITCREGCDCCCRRPFAITEEDGERLRRAAVQLPETERHEIQERARSAWQSMCVDFPGDVETGTLNANEEWKAWFFERHKNSACPVLDETTGKCRLYDFRPVCCRIYGPLIEISGQTSDPCPLCYPDVPASKVEQCRIRVDLPPAHQAARETVIAYVLS